MRSAYWREQWNKSAKENEDIRLISGWGGRTFQEMLFSITDVAKKLDLKSEDRLLDVGCGAGLFEIAFAHWLKETYGVDYSEEMVEVAKKNTGKYDNVIIEKANIQNLPFKDEFFDKILVNSVIQYLNNLYEVKGAFKELKRVTKKQGRILVSLIPDASKKDMFLNGYHKLGLSKEEIKKKIESNENAIWFDKDELKKLLKKIGFMSVNVSRPFNSFQKKYYFDLIIKNRQETI
jgi:ubiquinone/menaquinone biosynthesis C-methylase UbiE